MAGTASLRALQTYVDEAGNIIAAEEYEPNREPWSFAQVLPSIPNTTGAAPAATAFASTPVRPFNARPADIYVPR